MDWLDSRFVCARPLLHLASGHDVVDIAANSSEPRAARSDASQVDVVHAAHLQCDVLLLPIWLGAVLDHQQHFVHCSAMGH